MHEVIIRDETQSMGLLRVNFERITAEGRIFPTILVVARMSTLTEEVMITPFNMITKLKLDNETIGQGGLRECGRQMNVHPRQVIFELQTTSRALNYVNDQFRQDYLNFALHFDALMNVTKGQVSMIAKPGASALTFQVSKLDWLKQVLEPIKYADFTLIELPIPEVPDREQWSKALKHIEEAEAQYRTGNDPGVFSRCYAAYEAIKPIGKHLESVTNEDKRNAIKSMTDDMRRFFNKGRHVEKTGAESGEFPVDHRDAEFALYLIKSSVAYLAKLVHKV